MKALVKRLLMLSLLASFNASASSYPARFGGKFGNGLANAVTGVAEIPKTIIITRRKQGWAYAATAGFFTGMVYMVARTLNGAYDMATFVIPTKPIVTPDYIWQNFDQETSFRKTWELR
ncbi:MAG: exosortase system-associated protein, TIGR04073 family [Methylovulum sp.]|nr:exosortase system-associated protein, TIGR04073 family [Methylovulum sp.]